MAGEIVPHGPTEQNRLQVTPPLLASFATVAVRSAVEPVTTVAVLGQTETAMGGLEVCILEVFPPQLASKQKDAQENKTAKYGREFIPRSRSLQSFS